METKLTAVRDLTGDFTGIRCKGNIADDLFPLEQDLKITKKEKEIHKGILDGKTNREIALSDYYSLPVRASKKTFFP